MKIPKKRPPITHRASELAHKRAATAIGHPDSGKRQAQLATTKPTVPGIKKNSSPVYGGAKREYGSGSPTRVACKIRSPPSVPPPQTAAFKYGLGGFAGRSSTLGTAFGDWYGFSSMRSIVNLRRIRRHLSPKNATPMKVRMNGLSNSSKATAPTHLDSGARNPHHAIRTPSGQASRAWEGSISRF